MATVVISGGTGMIGTALTEALLKKGYRVVILTRDASKKSEQGIRYSQWDPERGQMDEEMLRKADYVIHLAGANVGASRWSHKRKMEILNSRVKSGELLVKALTSASHHVRAFISASAMGYYGPDPEKPGRPFTESDPPAHDYLANVVQHWERAVAALHDTSVRTVLLRGGIVLSREGGAFREYLKPFKLGVATILGTGKQVISWIHIDDLVRMYIEAMEDPHWEGVYNAVAPEHVTNEQLIRTMIREGRRKAMAVRVPVPVLKIALGEMSVEVLKSTTVSSAKTEARGFMFLFPTIKSAVRNLMR
ncbi:MAG TPA: TIGR01777 family oxidoreductase [Flavisolibacter sp.]